MMLLVIYGSTAAVMHLICRKAGFPGWFGLLFLIPIVNIILLYYVAFARWPRYPMGTGHRGPDASIFE